MAKAIAESRIRFDDLPLLKFVLGRNDEAAEICFRFLRSLTMTRSTRAPTAARTRGHQIVRKRTLLCSAIHEHVDRTANAGIDADPRKIFSALPMNTATPHSSE